MQELIAIAGTLLGVIVGAFLPLVIDWFRRPKIVVELDRPEHGDNWSGHAISITNFGRQVAKNCHGMMTLDATEGDLCPDDKIVRLAELHIDPEKFNVHGSESFLLHPGDWRPINNELLAWSQVGNPVTIDIYPHTHPLLDVFRLMKGPIPQLHFVSERGWASLRGAFLIAGREYTLTVTVGGENAAANQRVFLIRPTAKDDVEIVHADRQQGAAR